MGWVTSAFERTGTSMKKTFAAVLSAAMVAASLVVAEPAQAAISLTSLTMSTGTLVLDGNAGCGNRVTVTVKVNIAAGEQENLFGVSGDVVAPNGDTTDFLLFNKTGSSGSSVTYTEKIFLCGSEVPGRYRVDVEAVYWNGDGTSSDSLTLPLYIKRPTTLTYNASPEPAKRGTNLTHKGRLMFDPFAYGALYGPTGQTLKLSFKKAGTSSYVAKGTVKTTAGGYYSKKLRTDADGTWRVEFPANNYRQTQALGDYVDTK